MRRRSWFIAVGVVAAVLLVSGAVYAFNFAKQVNPPHTALGAATACGTAVPLTGLRTFRVVPEQSTASYTVRENLVLRNLPNNEAIGRTHAVQGDFRIRTGAAPLVAGMNVTVDLSQLQSDIGQRDNYVRRNFLQTDTYPNAVFVSTCAQGLPASYSDGQDITFQMMGNLTVHGKTNQETFAVQGKLAGDTITGTATTTVFMTDFGIDPPNIGNIAVAQNKVLITFNFTAKEG